MQEQIEIKMADLKVKKEPKENSERKVIDQKDLAALWAIGILVSLLLSLAGSFWNPPRYEARQSTSVDETEARVENSQNQLVANALNKGEIEYDYTMEKLVKPRPAYVDFFVTVARLILFPCGPIVIIGRLIFMSLQQSK